MPLVNDQEYAAFLAWKDTFGAWHTQYGAMTHQEYPKWVGRPGEASGRIVGNAEEERAHMGRPVEAPLPQIAEAGKDYRIAVDFNGASPVAHHMPSPQDGQAQKDAARQSDEMAHDDQKADSRPPMGQAPPQPQPAEPQAMPGGQAVHPPQPAPQQPPVQQTPAAPAKS